jgi:predicted acylesterase/phospholipase RssA
MEPTICDDIESISSRIDSLYDSGSIPGHPEDNDIEFIVFCGGGVAGIALLGVLRELKRRGLYLSKNEIKYWIGSSAGAIAAAFAAMGASPEYLTDLFVSTDTRIFLDYGGRSTDSKSWWTRLQDYRYGFSDLLSKWGIIRGEKFRKWFRERMTELGWDPHTNFTDLYNKTGRHLVITTTSLNTFETLYLCRSSYPYMEIADAVDVSILIPFIFPPIRMKDPHVTQGPRILVDGGTLDNLPINACDVISDSGEILAFNRKAVGFTLVHNGKWVPDYTEIPSLLKYGLTFIQAMHKRIQAMQSHQPYFWDRVAPIETTGITATDFGLEKEKVLKLIESGEKCAREYFDRRAAMIRERGPLPQNLFIPNYRLQHAGVRCLSDDLLEKTRIYQTNPGRSSLHQPCRK